MRLEQSLRDRKNLGESKERWDGKSNMGSGPDAGISKACACAIRMCLTKAKCVYYSPRVTP